MKDHIKSILVFSLFWVIGITGGYYLGVGSAIIPDSDVDYNLFQTEKVSTCQIEKPDSESEEEEEKESENAKGNGLNNDYLIILKQLDIDKIPALVVQTIIK